MRACGRTPPDAQEYSDWRREARLQNLELLDFYGAFLCGQQDMSGALRLDDVVVAMNLDGTPAEDRREMMHRLRLLHSLVMDRVRAREEGRRPRLAADLKRLHG